MFRRANFRCAVLGACCIRRIAALGARCIRQIAALDDSLVAFDSVTYNQAA